MSTSIFTCISNNYLDMLSCSVLTSPPMVWSPRLWARHNLPTIRLCKAICLPYFPFLRHLVKFLGNTVQINTSCKDYDSIDHHSHQCTRTTGPQGRGANHDHAQGGRERSDAGAYNIYLFFIMFMHSKKAASARHKGFARKPVCSSPRARERLHIAALKLRAGHPAIGLVP